MNKILEIKLKLSSDELKLLNDFELSYLNKLFNSNLEEDIILNLSLNNLNNFNNRWISSIRIKKEKKKTDRFKNLIIQNNRIILECGFYKLSMIKEAKSYYFINDIDESIDYFLNENFNY